MHVVSQKTILLMKLKQTFSMNFCMCNITFTFTFPHILFVYFTECCQFQFLQSSNHIDEDKVIVNIVIFYNMEYLRRVRIFFLQLFIWYLFYLFLSKQILRKKYYKISPYRCSKHLLTSFLLRLFFVFILSESMCVCMCKAA